MPKHFDWYVQISTEDTQKFHKDNNSCRESAAVHINDTVVHAIGKKCKYCGIYHNICNNSNFTTTAEKAHYEMGIDTYGTRNVRWLSTFLSKYYPTVTTSLKDETTWEGTGRIMYVLTGDHWVVNAWWWSALYFRLYNLVPDHTEDLGVLLERSRESHADIWYRPMNKNEHIAAFKRLIDGKEPPLSRSRFLSGPCSAK